MCCCAKGGGPRCHFENETAIPGGPATEALYINGKAAGTVKIEKQVRGRFGVESLDVGVDAATPVSRAYADKQPFWFTGEIEQVRFDFGDGTELSPREKLEQHIKMD